MSKKDGFIKYLYRFLGRPYIWGGDGSGESFGGFDCSGLVLEGLWAFGLYTGKDTNSEGLRKYASKEWAKTDEKTQGAVLFFGSNTATHTAVAIGGGLMIESGGGGSKCTTAENSTGFVRIRPVANRPDFLGAFLPDF